jgi:hypothetical protein
MGDKPRCECCHATTEVKDNKKAAAIAESVRAVFQAGETRFRGGGWTGGAAGEWVTAGTGCSAAVCRIPPNSVFQH